MTFSINISESFQVIKTNRYLRLGKEKVRDVLRDNKNMLDYLADAEEPNIDDDESEFIIFPDSEAITKYRISSRADFVGNIDSRALFALSSKELEGFRTKEEKDYCFMAMDKMYAMFPSFNSDVNEKVAAVTMAFLTMGCSMVMERSENVRLDRPFLYAIMHNESGLPVFTGIMNKAQK